MHSWCVSSISTCIILRSQCCRPTAYEMYLLSYGFLCSVTEQVTIPSDDTTYWCTAFKLPDNVIAQTRYITKVILAVKL